MWGGAETEGQADSAEHRAPLGARSHDPEMGTESKSRV